MPQALNSNGDILTILNKLLRLPCKSNALWGTGNDDVSRIERVKLRAKLDQLSNCLLYTSDAADE